RSASSKQPTASATCTTPSRRGTTSPAGGSASTTSATPVTTTAGGSFTRTPRRTSRSGRSTARRCGAAPSVTCGRFVEAHGPADRLGVKVEAGGEHYRLSPSAWAALVQLAFPAATAEGPGGQWLFLNDFTLAANVPAGDARLLAAHLVDR